MAPEHTASKAAEQFEAEVRLFFSRKLPTSGLREFEEEETGEDCPGSCKDCDILREESSTKG